MRRLLKSIEAATKVGMSIDEFYKEREILYAEGFPRPLMGDGKHGRAKYDSAAIDAWFDSKMDPRLRSVRTGSVEISGEKQKWTSILEQRLDNQKSGATA